MKRVKFLLKCVIIIGIFWGMTVGGQMSCGVGAGGPGCGCVPSEDGGPPPAFQYIVELVKTIIFGLAGEIELGSKYIKLIFVGPKCGNIVDTSVEYAEIDFTEPIDTSTFSIENNISVESIDYFSKVPVSPQLSFSTWSWQNNNTRLVLWINRASLRPDTIYTVTFISLISNPVKTAKGETITKKYYVYAPGGWVLTREEDLYLPFTFTVPVPDGVLRYIASYGAPGLDLKDCPFMVDAFIHFIPEQAHYRSVDEIPFTSFGMQEVDNYNLPIDVNILQFNPNRILSFPISKDMGKVIVFNFVYANCR